MILHNEDLLLAQEKQARREAISIIYSLFQSKWETLRPALLSIVRLPDVTLGCHSEGEADLKEAAGLLEQERGTLTLPAEVDNLCSMLNLESTQVRFASF